MRIIDQGVTVEPFSVATEALPPAVGRHGCLPGGVGAGLAAQCGASFFASPGDHRPIIDRYGEPIGFEGFRLDPDELAPDHRNMLWMMFTHKENRVAMRNWEPAARAVLSQFRALVGRRPDDPRLTALVANLSEASPEFRIWWSEYPDLLLVLQLPSTGPRP